MNKLFTFVTAAALIGGVFSASADEASDRIFANFISNPKMDENVEYLGMYNIGFPDADLVIDNSNSPRYECVLRNETTGKTWDLVWSSVNMNVTGNENNGFQFLFQYGNITEKGDYTVSFPKGAFLYEDQESPAFVTRFSIGMDTPDDPKDPEDPDTPDDPGDQEHVPNVLDNYVADPENNAKVDVLDKVIITFPDLGEDNIFGPMDNAGYSLVNSIGREFRISAWAPNGYTYIEMSIDDELPDGYYTMTLDEGLFLLSETSTGAYTDRELKTPKIVLKYTVGDYATVTSIDGEDALYNVVDAGGRMLLKDAPAESLRSLEPGFYVINGRKTILR